MQSFFISVFCIFQLIPHTFAADIDVSTRNVNCVLHECPIVSPRWDSSIFCTISCSVIRQELSILGPVRCGAVCRRAIRSWGRADPPSELSIARSCPSRGPLRGESLFGELALDWSWSFSSKVLICTVSIYRLSIQTKQGVPSPLPSARASGPHNFEF